MKVAIFGGSFDPPHIGHKAVIQEALEVLDIDRLFVIPTYLNPFKSESFLDSKVRLAKMKDLTKGMQKVEVIDYEVKIQRKCSSIQTVEYLKSKYKLDKIFLIVGADNLLALDRWHRIDELKDMVTFVIATRDDIDIPDKFISLSVDKEVCSTDIRNGENSKDEWIDRENS